MQPEMFQPVYSDCARGDNNFARCFAILYDAVPTFEIIGLKGSSFTSFVFILCTLAVPYSFPGIDPVGYIFLYLVSGSFDLMFRELSESSFQL